ncbi:hypothetical protein JTE90_008527 [Oedothorax gibbosus]|uniref:Uncharacterized protein n=1 Tax=Oedothorax gibbosus TaxID=931172 RepID=A0AAV6VI53_9ARAC|nr:hypothetical protein JTE90_008527 [Oedothorax gibbosus]
MTAIPHPVVIQEHHPRQGKDEKPEIALATLWRMLFRKGALFGEMSNVFVGDGFGGTQEIVLVLKDTGGVLSGVILKKTLGCFW